MNNFISTPLSFIEKEPGSGIELGRDLDSQVKMLDNLVELIVFTPRGSFAADPDFGFEYWNHEYSNIHYLEFNNDHSSVSSYNEVTKKQCQESIRHSLQTYHPQLKNVNISITLDSAESELQFRRKVRSKYSLRIIVEGIISDGLGTNREYRKDVAFLVEPTAKRHRY